MIKGSIDFEFEEPSRRRKLRHWVRMNVEWKYTMWKQGWTRRCKDHLDPDGPGCHHRNRNHPDKEYDVKPGLSGFDGEAVTKGVFHPCAKCECENFVW